MARPTKYEKVREQDRRDKISISKHLKQLSDIQEQLEENYDHISTAQIGALRLRSDISLNLLKKRLPDLKASDDTLTLEGDLNINKVMVRFEDGSDSE